MVGFPACGCQKKSVVYETEYRHDDPVPLITAIVSASLSIGTVPKQFKRVVVLPLLKKCALDTNNLKYLKPKSSLPFVSKVLEMVVLRRLQKHFIIVS